MSSSGRVYLIGAGPGDAALFTLRGKELLGRADVVIYDGLVNRELLRFAPPTAEIIYGGKHDRTRCVSQDELNALLLRKARAGGCVVRLKGGDPFIFGRGGEEAELLAAAGIPFEVVPGVSSIYSVPCYAGIPLTHRSRASGVTIVTGHDVTDPASPVLRGTAEGGPVLRSSTAEGGPVLRGSTAEGGPVLRGSTAKGGRITDHVDWPSLARMPGTLVVLMGLRNIATIADTLISHGRAAETPVAIISRGTTGRQRTLTGTLATIAGLAEQAAIAPPAVTVIGEVVKLRNQLNWFEQRPLFGRRIAVTQRSDLALPLVQALRDRGADVLQVPATRWVPHPDHHTLDQALARLKNYDWILFTNPHGIDFFLERLLSRLHDLRKIGPARLGAYGPHTGQRLREWHLQPAAVAADHKTPLIMEALGQCGDVRGQNFLILRGEAAYEKVPEALRAAGATVDVVPCYAVVPESDDPAGDAARLAEQGADWIVFASGLAVEHIHERFDLPRLMQRFPSTRIALASDTIQWALERLHLCPSAISRPNDVEDLVEAILRTESQLAPRI